ncbi:hypothetical protein J5893_01105 [bacterium]|nr:hypothetical protein [bacterium]
MFDPASIPPIGTPTSPATAKGKKSSLDAMLHNAPAETTLGIFFGKILMGLII